MRFRAVLLSGLVAALLQAAPAEAGLTSFQSFVGTYGVSTDGWGSTTQTGTISAQVPVGATVVAAYLYTSTANNQALTGVGGALAGNNVTYASLGTNTEACCGLTAARADVTSIVKPLVDGGPGGVYNFSITETSNSQDGSALVVVYSLASLPTTTVGILDGFALVNGDTAAINFASPLDPTAAGFFAEMRLGIGFSCGAVNNCTDQRSVVEVNGSLLTDTAGGMDDSDVGPLGAAANGRLITMGGFDDPFSNGLNYASNRERYNLVPFIGMGDTSISIRTSNASRDDNIFLAVFHVSGQAGINEPPPPPVPEPTTLSLLALGGVFALGKLRRRKTV